MLSSVNKTTIFYLNFWFKNLSLDGFCLTRLTIWDAASLEVLQVFTTVETIDKIEFRQGEESLGLYYALLG